MIDAPFIRPPRPRAVRMAGWMPARHVAAPAYGRKSLGLGLPSFNLDQTTLISAALGGAGVLLSDAFDPPLNTLVKIAGFGALGYAVYHLFAGDSGGPSTSDTGPKAGIESPVKVYPAGTGAAEAMADAEAIKAARAKAAADAGGTPLPQGDVQAVSGAILFPVNGETLKGASEVNSQPGYSGFWSWTEYDAVFQFTNYSPGIVTALAEYRVSYYTKGVAEVRSTRFTVNVPPLGGNQAGVLVYKTKIKIDYNTDADSAAGVLYLDGRAISPTVKYNL